MTAPEALFGGQDNPIPVVYDRGHLFILGGDAMIYQIPDVLKPEEAALLRQKLEKGRWIDGKKTAGSSASPIKTNQELAQDDPVFQQTNQKILKALAQSKSFAARALPLMTSTPQFNRYQTGQGYGFHYDNALGATLGRSGLMRGDLSATLFLSEPSEYEGGELCIEDTFGFHEVKLPAGHLVVYSGGSLHQVKPVTRGTRIGCFFWIQSLVPDEQERSILTDLDGALQQMTKENPSHPSITLMTRAYNHLLRKWSQV
jgi:PKHD-type hydroxylase